MNRPSFQFYTKDWRSNSKLRRCSPAARGVWVDILCALHDSDRYGVAHYPLKELASEVGASMLHVRELVDRGVLKGDDKRLSEPFIYTPRSGRRDGTPVVLVAEQDGPIWFSSRMVKDEYVRLNTGASTRFGASSPPPPSAPSPAPDRSAHNGKGTVPGTWARQGESPSSSPSHRQGDGPASASASATAVEKQKPPDVGSSSPVGDRPALSLVARTVPPSCPHEAIVDAYHRILPSLKRVSVWTPQRRQHLSARWKAKPKRQSLAWWEGLFAFIAEAPFLLGEMPGKNGGRLWRISLPWLVESEEHLVKVLEGDYHEEQA